MNSYTKYIDYTDIRTALFSVRTITDRKTFDWKTYENNIETYHKKLSEDINNKLFSTIVSKYPYGSIKQFDSRIFPEKKAITNSNSSLSNGNDSRELELIFRTREFTTRE